MRLSVHAAIVALLGAAASWIAMGAGEEDRKHPCASVADDAERLACYDEAFGRPPAASAPAAASVAPAAQARREFGLSEAEKRVRDPEKAKETRPESIEGVVSVRDSRRVTA